MFLLATDWPRVALGHCGRIRGPGDLGEGKVPGSFIQMQCDLSKSTASISWGSGHSQQRLGGELVARALESYMEMSWNSTVTEKNQAWFSGRSPVGRL